jgi:hypothetical protein
MMIMEARLNLSSDFVGCSRVCDLNPVLHKPRIVLGAGQLVERELN